MRVSMHGWRGITKREGLKDERVFVERDSGDGNESGQSDDFSPFSCLGDSLV